jgi:CP family cyanate transporter-like MFS transporter
MRSPSPGDRPTASHIVKTLALIWFAGAAIRIPLLATPPVIHLIHDDLRMTETEVGVLIGLPLALFAVAAIPGALLIARFGSIAIAVTGLFACAIAAAARGAAESVWMLYATTIVMGAGISIMQPTLPTLVRAWLPSRSGLATAIASNGMLIGVTLGPALTIPLVLPLLGGSWRYDLALWAVPSLLAALAFAFLAPRTGAAESAETPRRWWPDWTDPLIWLLGLTFGFNNAVYYSANAFLPDYLNSVGRGDLIGLALGWLNGSQLIASFVLLLTAEHLQRRTWPFTVFGPLTLSGILGTVFGDGAWIVLSAAVTGFSAAVTFVVTFALPPVLSPPDDVHRLAGGMFTISYTVAVITPAICGAFWDLTGVPWTAFVPLVLCCIALTVLGTVLSLTNAVR